MATAEIKAVITADDRASDTISRFGSGVGKVAGGIALGVGIAGAAVTAFGALTVKSFSDSEEQASQLNAVLKSTGGVAGVTASQATELASSLQKVTRFSDETIQSGENLLLTFTNIGKDIFPQATETMLNMSQALGQDVKSSAIQLGKALQDPIQGVTALRRVGVNFNETQRQTIENLVKTGKTAEAQKLILKELEVEFGNSAKAAGKTFAGQLDILKNSFDDLMEVVGGGIVEALTPFMDSLVNFATNNAPAIEEAVSGIASGIQVFFGYLAQAYNFVKDAFTSVRPDLEVFWNSIENNLIPSLQRLWHEVLEPMAPVIKDVFVMALRLTIDTMTAMTNATSSLINFIVTKWTEAKTFLETNPMAQQALQLLKNEFESTKGDIKNILEQLRIFWRENGEDIKRVAVGVSIVVGAAFMVVYESIRLVISAVSTLMTWFNLIMPVAKMLSGVLGGVAGSMGGGAGAITSILGLVGKRASGGPVNSGAPYIVGEKGPELFVPNGSGTIIPNGSPISQSSNTTININVGLMTGSAIERREAAAMMFEDLKDIASQRGQTVGQMVGA